MNVSLLSTWQDFTSLLLPLYLSPPPSPHSVSSPIPSFLLFSLSTLLPLTRSFSSFSFFLFLSPLLPICLSSSFVLFLLSSLYIRMPTMLLFLRRIWMWLLISSATSARHLCCCRRIPLSIVYLPGMTRDMSTLFRTQLYSTGWRPCLALAGNKGGGWRTEGMSS